MMRGRRPRGRERARSSTRGTRTEADNVPRAVQWALIEMGRVEESTPPLALAHTRDYANLRRALRSAGCAI